MVRTPVRRLMACLVAVVSLCFAASPAAAWTETVNTGKTGAYEGPDQLTTAGAICRYDHDFDLYAITVRPPRAYGHYAKAQRIAYRFAIDRDPPDARDWVLLYKGPWIVRTGSISSPATFPARTFSNLPPDPQALYRVRIIIRWVRPGTKLREDGRVVGTVDVYKGVHGDEGALYQGYCLPSYLSPT